MNVQLNKLALMSGLVLVLGACATKAPHNEHGRDVASQSEDNTFVNLAPLTKDQKVMVKSIINSYADLYSAMDQYREAKKNGAINMGLNETPFFEKIKPLLKGCETHTKSEQNDDDYFKTGSHDFSFFIAANKSCPFETKAKIQLTTVDKRPVGSFKALASGSMRVEGEELKKIVDITSTEGSGSAWAEVRGQETVSMGQAHVTIQSKTMGTIEMRTDGTLHVAALKKDAKASDGLLKAGFGTTTIWLNFIDKKFVAELRVLFHPVEAVGKDYQKHRAEWRYFVNREEVSRDVMLSYLKPEHSSHVDSDWPATSTYHGLRHALNPWLNIGN